MEFICKPFYELTLDQLYEIMVIRQTIFVLEQNCPFVDADGRDQASWHLMGYWQQELVAYARILPVGVAYPDYASIGRVVSSSSVRSQGFGKLLVQKAIEETYRLCGVQDIKIGAQQYLEHFYQRFGFESTPHHYLEDGIPHLSMIKKVTL
ncbi:MAG: GNAT family N-acetyltransferase [Saprospiraceae bacterium]|nr:GNAT family N-acetyltransferase [Saprospiraceae bacterium]